MKVSVRLSIEVDPDEWNQEHGTDYSVRQIRTLVKQDVVEAVSDGLTRLNLTYTVKEN